MAAAAAEPIDACVDGACGGEGEEVEEGEVEGDGEGEAEKDGEEEREMDGVGASVGVAVMRPGTVAGM